MAKITHITVNNVVKLNIGNYSSMEGFLSMTAELEPGDNPDTITRLLSQKIHRLMAIEFGELLNRRLQAISPDEKRKWLTAHYDMIMSFNDLFPELAGLIKDDTSALDRLKQLNEDFNLGEN